MFAFWRNVLCVILHISCLAALVIPGPQSEESKKDFTEKRPENQPSTPNPSFGAGATEDNTLIEVKSNHQSRTITSNPGFLPHNHGGIQPTLDKFENNVFAEYHQEKGEKKSGIRDAVEVTPGKTGNMAKKSASILH